MSQFLNTQDLSNYLNAVFEVECELYAQKKIKNSIATEYNRLGRHRNIPKPSPHKVEGDIWDSALMVGIIGGLIAAVVGFIMGLNQSSSVFERVLDSIWGAVSMFVIGGIGSALTIGLIVGICERARETSKARELDQQDEEAYRESVAQDKKRVEREARQQECLAKDYQLLERRITDTEATLTELYDYDIVDRDYRNIYAISSFYGYLKKGRCQSLAFNPANGDKGAYNIYEEERRLNLIITNTEEIIRKLDTVIENQYVLADGLRQAEQTVASLNGEISRFAKNTAASLADIKNSQAMIEYNTACTRREAALLAGLCFDHML